MNTASKRKPLSEQLAYGLFWSWNLIFLSFMVLGYAPRLLPELIIEVRNGVIPFSYLIYASVLACVPVAGVILGLTLLRRAPARLFALGYVIEGPLMLILAVRFFVIRQATLSLTALLLYAGVGMAAFLWHLLDVQDEGRGAFPGAPWLRLAGLTVMLITCLYASIWIAFYAVPVITEALRWILHTIGHLGEFFRGVVRFFQDSLREGLIWLPFALLGFILILYTGTLFVLTPVAVPLLSARAWWRALRQQIQRSGRFWPLALVVVVVLASVGLFFFANQQPQKQVFEWLSEPPASSQQAQALVEKSDAIRNGLLNAYLAPFRYISSTGEVRHISDIYMGTFKLDSAQAFAVQRLYEGVARPLIYSPAAAENKTPGQDNIAFRQDPIEAARLYQSFFDQPIVEGERAAIVNAVRSTWSADQAEAAWQAVDDREVHLMRQEVTVSEHGDWADVELFEVYQNNTLQRQEVIYYFNLPESAVLTGIWLGESPDREARFTYRVSPRGAAQAVYVEQTRRQIDPALLEQIGPRQYRLRAFPIQPLVSRWDENRTRRVVEDAPPFYLWLTYRTFAIENAWPLPRLAVVRNLFWDKDTVRLLNGEPWQVAGTDWLPVSVPASQAVQPVSHRYDLPGGESVLAVPASQVALPVLPQGLRLAMVLDRSRSMAAYVEQISSTLHDLQEKLGADVPVDIYLTSSAFRGEQPSVISLADLDAQNILYFGGQNAAELLAQFDAQRENRAYDAVLVFTDGSGYELGPAPAQFPIPDVPVWLVHMGGNIPLGYDDLTLEAIQASGGGVEGDLDAALQRFALARVGAEGEGRDVLDGYVWSVLPTDAAQVQVASVDEQDGFAAFAARRLILAEMQRNRNQIKDLETLDYLHEIAKQYSIITPYSSMIVLVTDRQQQQLDLLETKDDRFTREYEAIGETNLANQIPMAGVPEPHEWLLIGVAMAILLYYSFRKRLASGNV
ncbi:MAG: TIGR02921 family PEP-CTERM protein [Chloroflexota bacterium]